MTNSLKSAICALLVLTMIFGFCACKGKSENQPLSFEYTIDAPQNESSNNVPQSEISETETIPAESEETDTSESESTVTVSQIANNEEAVPPGESGFDAQTNQSETSTVPAQSGAYVGQVKNGRVSKENDLYYVTDSSGEKFIIVNKSYPLPESYGPGTLTSECQSAFDKLVSGAKSEGLDIWVMSGYRSYSTQSRLYNNYVARDGQAAADKYSARPGHSEHQTGLAIDVNSLSTSFANTAEGKWLKAHCPEYGFIIRYGEDKISSTGYQYEPWHIRYIGSPELARKITDSGLSVEEYYGLSSNY